MNASKLPYELLLAGALLVATSGSSSAQGRFVPAHMIPVTVLVPEAPDQAHGEMTITRRASDGGYVVLIPRTLATQENLRSALGRVNTLLERDGDSYRDNLTVRVSAGTMPGSDHGGGSEMARLLASPVELTHARGRAHVTVIYLPGKSARAGLRAAKAPSR